jgi:aryl-alcohol dehydrogenase-like predicted oxidoreductase
MSLGSVYGSAGTLEEKVAFLEHAHAIGARFWDTADIYFDSEDAVGAWIKESGNRDDVFLATKFALHYSGMEQSVRSDPEYVKAACEKSLKRLGVETIDLYYCHRVDGVTPIEKTIEAMVELKEYVVLLITIGTSFTDHLLAKARSNTSDSLNALH